MKNNKIMAAVAVLGMLLAGVCVIPDMEAANVNSYGSFASALAGDDAEIVLKGNVDVSAQLVVDRPVILDLNGYTISNSTDIMDAENGVYSLISVQEGGSLVILDTSASGQGSVSAKNGDCYAVAVSGGASLVIMNGVFVGNVHAIYLLDGYVDIYGGTFSVQEKHPDDDSDAYTLFIDDDAQNAYMGVFGGTFIGFDPSDCMAHGEHSDLMKEGYTVTEDDGNYVGIYDVASIVGDSSHYTTLESAIEAAEEGATINLLTPVVTSAIVTPKSFTLDMGGNVLYLSKLETTGGTVVLKDGHMVGALRVFQGSNVTIDSDATLFRAGNPGVFVRGVGTYGEEGCMSSVLNIKGSVSVIGASNGLSTNGTDLSNSVINIFEGASVESRDDLGCYLPSGTLNMNGGSITGTTGIYFKAQAMNLLAGTVHATGPRTEVITQNNGGDATGDAIVIQNMAYPAADGYSVVIGDDMEIISDHSCQLAYFEGSATTGGTVSIPLDLSVRGAGFLVGEHLIIDMEDAFEFDTEAEEIIAVYGNVFHMLNDMVLEEDVVLPDVSITMDMNGHDVLSDGYSLTVTDTLIVKGDDDSAVTVPFIVLQGASLELFDGVYLGDFTVDQGGYLVIHDGIVRGDIEADGRVAITNGTFEGDISCVPGGLVIQGGIFDGSNVTGALIDCMSTIALKNGASLPFDRLVITATGMATTVNGTDFAVENARLSGVISGAQAVQVRQTVYADNLVVEDGGELIVINGAILRVTDSLVCEDDSLDIIVHGKLQISSGATVSGQIMFERMSVKLDNVTGGDQGFEISKGSIVLTGAASSGTIDVKGDVKLSGSVSLNDAELIIQKNSSLLVPQGVTLNGGSIVNKGTINVYGTLGSDVNNSAGKILVRDGADVTGEVSGKSPQSIHVEIMPFEVPKCKVDATVLLSVVTEPADAVLDLQGASWLRVNGHELVGTPDRGGDYEFTLTASINIDGRTYTDAYTFTVHVDGPVADGGIFSNIDWKVVAIVFFVAVIALIILARFL